MGNGAQSVAERYREVNDFEKEDLIKSYLPLVRRVVHRLAGRLPADIDIKEMMNSGIIGLVDALEKYDPKFETNFITYAQFRIRGAILDSFRAQDWAPRSLRHKAHVIEDAYHRIEQKLGRHASEDEVAKELNLPINDLRELLGEIGSVAMMSFEDLGYGHGDDRYNGEEGIQSAVPDPLNSLLDGEKVKIIARALDRLPEKERLVTTLYFYEELNLKEIGEILGVTESRASQIRTRAICRLSGYLKSGV